MANEPKPCGCKVGAMRAGDVYSTEYYVIPCPRHSEANVARLEAATARMANALKGFQKWFHADLSERDDVQMIETLGAAVDDFEAASAWLDDRDKLMQAVGRRAVIDEFKRLLADENGDLDFVKFKFAKFEEKINAEAGAEAGEKKTEGDGPPGVPVRETQ